MKHITIAIFILSFLVYRPYKMQDSGLKYSDDDDAYLSYALSAADLKLPDLGRHPPGSGLLAAPFVFAFSLLDRSTCGNDVASEGKNRTITASWTLFGFVFSTLFYFWLSCLILYKTLRYFYDDFESTICIILMVLIQGVPLYVFRRPVFAHVYELFLQSLLVYVLFANHPKTALLKNRYVGLLWVCWLAGMAALVRYNNIIIALFWPLAVWGVDRDRFDTIGLWKMVFFSYLILSLSVLVIILTQNFYQNDWGRFDYFAKVFGIILSNLQNLSISFYLKRLVHVFFGVDWGLVYTAPFLVVSLIWFWFLPTGLKRRLILPLTAVGITFFLFILSWRSQGAWYGYRYFIFSAIPLLVLPCADLLSQIRKKYTRKIYVAILVTALLPLFSMICFEGNSTTLTLFGSSKYKHPIFWGNPKYQLEVWKIFFLDPIGFIIAVFKGGPLYMIYLLAVFLKKTPLLPQIVLEKYPRFELTVLFKSLIIYLLPFVFYATYRYLENRNPRKHS